MDHMKTDLDVKAYKPMCGELILGNVYTFLVFLRYSKNCQCCSELYFFPQYDLFLIKYKKQVDA